MDFKRWAATGGAAALVAAAAIVAVNVPWGGEGDATESTDARPAPPPDPPDIGAERRIELQRALNEVVVQGSSGAVAELVERNEGGSDVWNGVAGVADRERGTPVDPDAHFRIASLSKPFVAATALLLVQDGSLELSDTLEDMLPGVVEGGQQITLRMLLSHTSGLYSYNKDMPSVVADPERSWTPEELVEVSQRHRPVFPPATDVEYSNTNYVLVAMAIERVTGRPYAEAVQERVIEPLGLEDTSIPFDSEMPEPVLRAYTRSHGSMVDITEFNPTRWYGTAQVVSTVGDLNRFWRALLDGELLDEEMLEQMLTVQAEQENGYGYALGPRSYTLTCGEQVWMHPGNIPGSRTWTVHGDDRDFTLFQARSAKDPDPPAWAMIELAMCPEEAPAEPEPSPSTGDYPGEDVAGTGRGQDGGK
ncbi:serine hydrolase domain-containing protein [Nocardiopsis potens]|uniref:serine hydrolase domain-containing protein n=1 Tax=Nocardiopsis potens TaxID=1246458 RepID=UPI0003740B36|nr:serine hydrolase domain-containing protein [Nocardiopsis potens]